MAYGLKACSCHPLTKSTILQPEFQYACVLVELYHCQPWVNPMHCGLCSAEKVWQAGCWGLLNPTQPICNLTGESRAIHDCSVADMPQIKKWGGGEVEAKCLIKIGKRKKSVVLKIKGALDKCNIIPNFFQKKVVFFYTIRSVGMGNDCMLSFTF